MNRFRVGADEAGSAHCNCLVGHAHSRGEGVSPRVCISQLSAIQLVLMLCFIFSLFLCCPHACTYFFVSSCCSASHHVLSGQSWPPWVLRARSQRGLSDEERRSDGPAHTVTGVHVLNNAGRHAGDFDVARSGEIAFGYVSKTLSRVCDAGCCVVPAVHVFAMLAPAWLSLFARRTRGTKHGQL